MKNALGWLSMLVLTGCAGVERQGVSHFDKFEQLEIVSMSGNTIGGRVFERTIICLNARREIRTVASVTNQSILSMTNYVVNSITNQTVMLTTNQSRMVTTNQLPIVSTATTNTAATGEAEAKEPVLAANVLSPSALTNQTVIEGTSFALSRSAGLTSTTANSQTQLNNQITVTTNNQSITVAQTQTITGETNQTVSLVTNAVVVSRTNQNVQTDLKLHDYYLHLEFTPPPDFVLQSGESLILLIDGVRFGFAQTNAPASFTGRRGFVSAFYKVSPEVITDISKASEVKLRLRGNGTFIEKPMSQSSRAGFQEFVRHWFDPSPAAAAAESGPTGLPPRPKPTLLSLGKTAAEP